MEEWNTDWSRGALERIVALLCALANLADLAAGVSFLRRRRVLGIVSHGEVEARAFVIGTVTGEPVPIDALETTHDAARLAVRLRALALMLCLILAQAAQFKLPRTVGRRAGLERPAGQAGHHAAVPAPDTS
jgi:hypothetical protein